MAKLEDVLGCTIPARSAISINNDSGIVAYPAGSTVVFWDPTNNSRLQLNTSSKNAVRCLCFSPCGKFLSTGETGHEPKVKVWQLYDNDGLFAPQEICTLDKHQFEIICVRFSLDGKHLISVGDQHDKLIALWDWKDEKIVASNRLSSKVHALDITEDGKSYVTVGVRHVKFWHCAESNSDRPTLLQGRSAILSDQRNNTFKDVCCGSNNRTFAIAENGILLEFHDKKLLNTFDLLSSPLSIALGIDELYIGFENGKVHSLNKSTMELCKVFCKPHYLLCDVAKASQDQSLLPKSHPKGCRYPDVKAICYNWKKRILTAVYSDRSIYNWQESSNDGLIKLSSQIFHVGPILAVEIYPVMGSWLPAGTFFTGGVDQTVRIWSIDVTEDSEQSSIPQNNVYSKELKKVIYLTKSDASLNESKEKVASSSIANTTCGIKSLRVSPDGNHLAVGSRDGILSIYSLIDSQTEMVACYFAHESDIMCLEYSDPQKSRYLLATGSRDRLIHIFDPLKEYSPLETIDDHASSISSIVFLYTSDASYLITCAVDKQLVIRKLNESSDQLHFSRLKLVSSSHGFNSIAVFDTVILAACHDRRIRTYSHEGKLLNLFKCTIRGTGNLNKIRIDPSLMYAVTVSSDRNIYIIDLESGEIAVELTGNADPLTDIVFSQDGRRLIGISYNGCIFIWRISKWIKNENKKKKGVVENIAFSSRPKPANIDSVNCIAFNDDGFDHEAISQRGSLNIAHITENRTNNNSECQLSRNVLSQKDITDSADLPEFVVKKMMSDVVRRSMKSNDNSPFEHRTSDSNTKTMADNDETSSQRHPTSDITTSRSMSSLRPDSVSITPDREDSFRRPRRKWDFNDAGSNKTTYVISPLSQTSTKISSNSAITGGKNIDAINHSASFSEIAGQQQRNRLLLQGSPSAIGIDLKTLYGMHSNSASQKGSLDQSLSRSSSSACSLSKKFMSAETQTMWTPLSAAARRSSSSVHHISPKTPLSSIVRRQSDKIAFDSTSNFYQQTSNIVDVNEEKSKYNRRTRNLHRIKQRRLSLAVNRHSSSAFKLDQEDDYNVSELHLRSRSQSPSQLALKSSVEKVQRQRQDSDVSMSSTITMISSRLTPSSSRTNLRPFVLSNHQSSSALDRLIQMRDKLRKSQENLAGIKENVSAISLSPSLMLRSKSFGNLRFSAAAPLDEDKLHLDGGYKNIASELKGDFKRACSLSSLAGSSHFSCMGNMKGIADLVTTESLFNGRGTAGKLAQTVDSLKKASNPDLSQLGVENTKIGLGAYEDGCVSTFFTRNQRGKGAVQKRVERYHPLTRLSRDTTSESDSNNSEVQNQNFSPIIKQQINAKLYHSPANGSNRSVSCVESLPKPGTLQSTRRIFEQQRHSASSVVARKSPNYLAQKLANRSAAYPSSLVNDSKLVSPSETIIAREFSGRTHESNQMARHITDCMEQFSTGLDKVLQAIKLLEASQHLPVSDKNAMTRWLDQYIRNARERLDIQIGRHDPDGGRSDSPNSLPNQQQGANKVANQLVTSQPIASMSSAAENDSSSILHGHYELLPKNMAKLN